ncbi:tryptophan synthase subunit alpha [Endozoicomonas gorgoniicola]|uniref:Tryptophan synthase alpha chain n=2 Tax=Endozoicomonas gorgoniicola TaxID=1234144 RepID=A0ABT3MS35_9GAMM|nr:tryptophan synthase subunit alpha [Endozoicomonas gorgoniicola]MCW7552182.1 tryptophan synthase subunit alpha [Endozoicomonas gorgoniicola]
MRIKQRFARLQAENRKALVPYITAGDPAGKTVEMMHELVRNGADVIELGFPFSDPVADGPVIAKAHLRALSHGVTLNDVFSMVSHFRETDNETPVVLMGYLNPIEIMGYEVFAESASKAGVDGVLVVDLPPEFADALVAQIRPKGIDMINLITPTTSDERIKKICSVASGFIYYVSLKGVTGSARLDVTSVQQRVAHIKQFTDMPVGVGFGIRDGESAAAISQAADAVIVGTVLVSELAKFDQEGGTCLQRVGTQVSEMRIAMDNR